MRPRLARALVPPSEPGLVAAFLLSRLLFLAVHVNMRTDTSGSMHLLPPEWISAKALLLMPGQPPGFQMLVMAVGALPGLPLLAFTAMGLATTLCTFRIMRELVAPRLAWGAALLLAVAPAFILYERTVYYPMPILCALTVGLYLVSRARSLRDWSLAFGVLALPCWLHSFFQPVVLLAVGLACLLTASDRSTVARALVLPLALAAAPTLKNGLLYDVWASSTWAPFSLANIYAAATLTPEERAALPFATPLTSLPPFSNPAAYGRPAPPTGEISLDAARKPNGADNWMSLATVPAGAALMAETRQIIAARPEVVARGLQGALYFFMQSPSTFFHARNRERIGLYDTLWGLVTTGALSHPDRPLYSQFRARRDLTPTTLWGWGRHFGWRHFPVLSLLSLPLLYGWGIWLAATRRSPLTLALLVVASYVGLLGCLAELGENMRFKAYIGPILAIWLVSLVSSGLAWLRRRNEPTWARPPRP
ncbi:MAG: hypothetical protein AB7O57_00020 [Hyphomicrobiaceae bacterium]